MKGILRFVLYAGILAGVLCIPVERTDVGQLRPVQLVSLYTQGENIVIETDTGDTGIGTTITNAFENLENTTPAVIYLDTADFLLVTEEALEYVEQLDRYLKTNVQICQQEEPVDTVLAAQYLSARGMLPRLKNWEKGAPLPVLQSLGEKIILLEKSENKA